MSTPNHARSPNPSHSHETSSVCSMTSPRPGAYGVVTTGTPSQSQGPQLLTSPSTSYNQTSYRLGLDSDSNSLGASPTELTTTFGKGPDVVVGAQMSQANIAAQKRAYRQRRKDPSCDACRERKVKCDATETTSCSECLSRNVTCQFTKETNRRMSSIKQVQDLERQVAQMRKENSQLRSLIAEKESRMDVDPQPSTALGSLPEIASQPTRKHRPLQTHHMNQVRSNLRNYGRGLFQLPGPYRQMGPGPLPSTSRTSLPPKRVADHLLHSYYKTIHQTMPILHWPTFEQEYEEIYKVGSLQGVPTIWSAMFFAVLAVGVLYTVDPSIRHPGMEKDYLETSVALVDVWNDELVIDHVRQALLTSVLLVEKNLKSAATVWMAACVRLSQDMGLHADSGPWPTIEGEMRRRVWWAVYAWDRVVSLETSRPPAINDLDCDVQLPTAIDDHYIYHSGMNVPHGAHASTNLLLPTIHVARAIPEVMKLFNSPTISPQTLTAIDTHLNQCHSAFPSRFHLTSRERLDPRTIHPILSLLNVRFMLHRHNLSTSCSLQTRTAAIEACTRSALDTVSILSRIHQVPPPSRYQPVTPYPIPPLGPVASSMVATHIWRCTLMLLFTARYEAASVCVRASTSIGTYREINTACGRYLHFFLGVLISKRQQGYPEQGYRDEELLAYVSGDAQASLFHNWVWQSSETATGGDNPKDASLFAGKSTANSSEEGGELGEWSGWARVEELVQTLMHERPNSSSAVISPNRKEEAAYTYGENYNYGSGPPVQQGSRYQPATPLPPMKERPNEQTRSARPVPVSRASDRISIANII